MILSKENLLKVRVGKGFYFCLFRRMKTSSYGIWRPLDKWDLWRKRTDHPDKNDPRKELIGLLVHHISKRIKFHRSSPNACSCYSLQTHNTNNVFVVQVQLKIKAGFGIGVWLSPSLNPACLLKWNPKSVSCQMSHLIWDRRKTNI